MFIVTSLVGQPYCSGDFQTSVPCYMSVTVQHCENGGRSCGWCMDISRAVLCVTLICFSTLILFVFIVLEVMDGRKIYLQATFLSDPGID